MASTLPSLCLLLIFFAVLQPLVSSSSHRSRHPHHCSHHHCPTITSKSSNIPPPPPHHKSPPPAHHSSPPPPSLSFDYYSQTCPQLESVIQNKVIQWLKIDLTLSASLLRLHFHDCMATGCDASILLDDPKGRSTERYSVFSKGLRGFEVVDEIKRAVEVQCPGVVSCADILTTIARDVVVETGGPFWFVPFGRKDSLTSRIVDAAKVPHQSSNANELAKLFQTLGLTVVDLATLSGAHTIGRSHCFSLYGNSTNTRMNATYATFLKNECKKGPWTPVYNDPISPYVTDLQYYINLKNNMGLFKSDQSLFYDNDMTKSMIEAFLTQPGMWESQFAVSMVNMGNIPGPRQGEIRHACSVPNSRGRRSRKH